jgi:hypothetical protein
MIAMAALPPKTRHANHKPRILSVFQRIYAKAGGSHVSGTNRTIDQLG